MTPDGGVPTALVLLLIVIGAALVIFCVSALISILAAPGMPPAHRLGWVVAVLILQFFAPLVWFTVGRSRYRTN